MNKFSFVWLYAKFIFYRNRKFNVRKSNLLYEYLYSVYIFTSYFPGPQVIRMTAELLTSDSVSLTCYTNYDIQNVTYLWYISNKPVTGMKTKQIFANNRSQETITVLNLTQYILKQTQSMYAYCTFLNVMVSW